MRSVEFPFGILSKAPRSGSTHASNLLFGPSERYSRGQKTGFRFKVELKTSTLAELNKCGEKEDRTVKCWFGFVKRISRNGQGSRSSRPLHQRYGILFARALARSRQGNGEGVGNQLPIGAGCRPRHYISTGVGVEHHLLAGFI